MVPTLYDVLDNALGARMSEPLRAIIGRYCGIVQSSIVSVGNKRCDSRF